MSRANSLSLSFLLSDDALERKRPSLLLQRLLYRRDQSYPSGVNCSPWLPLHYWRDGGTVHIPFIYVGSADVFRIVRCDKELYESTFSPEGYTCMYTRAPTPRGILIVLQRTRVYNTRGEKTSRSCNWIAVASGIRYTIIDRFSKARIDFNSHIVNNQSHTA